MNGHGPTTRLVALRALESLISGVLLVTVSLQGARLLSAGEALMSRESAAGWLLAAFGVMLAMAQLLAGRCLARGHDPRTLAALGLAGAGLLSLLMPLVDSFAQLLLLRGLQGLALAFVGPASIVYVVQATAEQQRGVTIGRLNAWKSAGFAIGPLVAALAATSVSLAAIEMCAAAGLLLTAASMRSLNPVHVSAGKSCSEPGPPLARYHGAAFVASAIATSLLALQPAFLDRLEQSLLGFAVAVSAMLVVRTLLGTHCGRWVDRLTAPRAARLGASIIVVGTLLQAVAHDVVWLTVARLVLGLGMALFVTAALCVVTRGEGRGPAVASFQSAAAWGVTLGPLLSVFLQQYVGTALTLVVWAASLALLTTRASVLEILKPVSARRQRAGDLEESELVQVS